MSEHNFAALYLKAREKEKRIYTDEEVAMLPFVKREHLHFKEWEVRKNSFKKLRTYLQQKNKTLRIFDAGCGNGWMSNSLSEINNSVVTGIDPNDFEIKQAKRVFKDNDRVEFFCDDVLKIQHTRMESVDIIVLAASIQYFQDLKILVGRLFEMLGQDGEIHILDSPFYDEENIGKAKKSTQVYYERLGCPGMANYYHHHSWLELREFNFETMNRSFIQRFFLRIFKIKKNYFPWIIIKKR
jgi:ubiquinone/menaquinone biosynthesis C-methylase UbiE